LACVIAAPCSGSGKTLLSLCLSALARERGEQLQPFKVGPDYLDPQLLTAVSGRSCRNLDPLLCGDAWVRRCFQWHASHAPRVLVEGVMGLFDGRGPSSEGSTAAVASLLELPVVLVVEASRQAGSLAALVRGFRDHGPPQISLAGVVLNRVAGERHRALLEEALTAIGVPLLGALPPHPALQLPSRHLGLLPAGELDDLAERRRQWASLAEGHLALERLWPLLESPSSPPEDPTDPILSLLKQPAAATVAWATESAHCHGGEAGTAMPITPAGSGGEGDRDPLPIAIATDQAFHFRYPEAGELLQAVGFLPIPWSPLADELLPDGCRAVLLPGGYPELHARQLAASRRSLDQLTQAAACRIPIVAECGGLLLLGHELRDEDDTPHAMAGVLPFRARRGALSLGYRQAEVSVDGLVVRQGEQLLGHEFHRWQIEPLSPESIGDQEAMTMAGPLWHLEGWGCQRRPEGWTTSTLHASWLHLHWAGCPEIPLRLAAASASAVPLRQNGVTSSLETLVRLPTRSAGA
jgi:cobyrinic acid a,c-diamide synthase